MQHFLNTKISNRVCSSAHLSIFSPLLKALLQCCVYVCVWGGMNT